MPSVDDRIVRMQFDNAEFERKVRATIASLSELDKALKMEGASKGLSAVSEAASKLKFDPNVAANLQKVKTNIDEVGHAVNGIRFDKMADNVGAANKSVAVLGDSIGAIPDATGPVETAIESISGKFLVMSSIAVTALATITSKALAAGESLIKSFSFEGLSSGFAEYQLNIGAIQTILANTSKQGTTLLDVNDALDQLNTYSDKTIYNFGQMVSNIGKFTTAGVDLQTSVNSIKGLSNVAALSGANAEQAAGATYQLSQALSAGTVKLRDWISVEQAGMAGPLFQEALFETGKAMKTLSGVPMGQTFEEWKKGGNNFRESLSDGWLTADVLGQTLQTLTGDMTEAEIAALGYSEAQAKELHRLGKLGLDSATSVRTMTQLMSTLKETVGSGWSATFRIIVGDFEQATELFSTAYGFLSGVIGKFASDRNTTLSYWEAWGGRDKLIGGITSAIVAITKVLGAVRKAFRDVFPKNSVSDLVNMSKAFRDFMYSLIPGPETIDKITRTARGFFSIFAIGWEIIKQFAKLMFGVFSMLGKAGSGPILEVTAHFGDFLYMIKRVLVDSGGIAKIFTGIAAVAVALGKVLGTVVSEVVDFFAALFPKESAGKGADKAKEGVGGFIDMIKELSVSTDKIEDITDKITDFFEGLAESISGLSGGVVEKAQDILETIVDGFKRFFGGIGEVAQFGGKNSDTLIKVLQTGLLGGIAFFIGRFVKGTHISLFGGTFKTIRNAFDQMTNTLKDMQRSIKANIILKIAIAIGILAAAMFVLGSIDPMDLARASGAMVGLFTALLVSLKALTKITDEIGGRKILALGLALVAISAAVLILSFALEKLAGLDAGELGKGGIAVAAALTAITVAVNFMKDADMGRVGIEMLFIAAAIIVLAFAIEKFASIDDKALYKGGAAVAVALFLISRAVKFMAGSDIAKTGINVLLISAAVVVFSYAVERFAAIPGEKLVKGGLAVAVALKAIALAVEHMGGSDIKGVGINVLLIAGSMIILAFAIEKLGGIDFWTIIKGLGAMMIAMVAISVFANAMKDTEKAALSILAISASIFIIATALAIIAEIPLGPLATAMAAIIVALLAIAAVAIAISYVGGNVAIGALAIALGALALAFIVTGIAAILFARAFEILGRAGPKALDNLREVIIEFGSLIPDLAANFAEGFVRFIDVIAENIPHVVDQFVVMGTEILRGFGDMIGPMEDLFRLIMDTVLRVINEYIPKIVATGINIIMSLLAGARQVYPAIAKTILDIILNILALLNFYLPQIIAAGTALLVNFLNGIAAAIPQVATAVGNIITAFIGALGLQIQRVINAGVKLIMDMIAGIVEAQKDIVKALAAAVVGFFEAMAETALGFGTAALNVMIQFIEGLTAAINGPGKDLVDAFIELIEAIVDGMVYAIDEGGDAVVAGFKDLANAIIDEVREQIPLIGSPSKDTYELGHSIIEGFVHGMADGTASVLKAAGDVSDTAINALKKTIEDAADNVSTMIDVNPVITPVLDLSAVQEDAAKISDFMQAIGTVSLNQASAIARTQVTQPLTSEQDRQNGSVNFEQNIYAPEQLSTADIYKQTRNQIVMAKEELKIP